MAGQGPPGSYGQGPRLTPHSSAADTALLTTDTALRALSCSSDSPGAPHQVCVSENVRPSNLSSRKWLRVPGVARRHQFAHRSLGPALARRRRPISSPPARTVNGPLGMVPLRGGTRSLPQATIGGIIRLSSGVRPDCPSLPAPGLRSRGQTSTGAHVRPEPVRIGRRPLGLGVLESCRPLFGATRNTDFNLKAE